MRKIITLSIFLVCLLNVSFAQTTIVSMADVEAVPGQTVLMPVYGNNFTGIRAFQFEINYDSSVIEYITILNIDPNFPGILLSSNDEFLRLTYLNMYGLSNLPENGKLFDLSFTFCSDMAACAASGGYTELEFNIEKTMVVKGSQAVPITLINGSIFTNIEVYLVTINKQGQGNISINGSTYTKPFGFSPGNAVSLLADPAYGWEFVSWTGSAEDLALLPDPELPEAAFTMPDRDIVLTANFVFVAYTIQATAAAGGAISPSGQVVVLSGGSQTFTINPQSAYNIDDVLVDGLSVGPVTSYAFTNVTADHTIHAQFTKKKYTLSYLAGANGTIQGPTQQIVDHGSNGITVTAIANPGFVFVTWNDGVTTSSRTEMNVTANLTVTALFEEENNQTETLYLANETITSGSTACFSASVGIYLAGIAGPFVVQSGANLTLISGQYIIMQQGTHIQSGSNFHAYIAPEGPFCPENEKNALAGIEDEQENSNTSEDEDALKLTALDQANKLPAFNIFPNPTSGMLTLELSGLNHDSPVHMEVFSLGGNRVLSEILPASNQHTLNLEGQHPGIYFIRVYQDNFSEMKRVVKY